MDGKEQITAVADADHQLSKGGGNEQKMSIDEPGERAMLA